MILRWLPAVVAFGSAACDPTWHCEGHIVDGMGDPVAGVKVTLACATHPSNTVTSDAAGRFSFGGVGSAFGAATCTVRMAKPAYATRTLKTVDLCYRNSTAGTGDEPCDPGEGTVLLSAGPATPAPAPS